MPQRAPSSRILLALGLLAVARIAPATVVEATSSGFLVQHEVTIRASANQVYRALLHVGAWWAPAHTYSGNSMNLSIDPKPGGCFCERLAHGGAVEHMMVVNLQPDRLLRMTGALGPLQGSGLAGSLTFALTPDAAGTTLRVSYSVGGYMQGGVEKVAPAVDQVLGEQIGRLKQFAEGKSPA
jgi:uncharacterized protein YndB with AHSA1/START domain